MRFVMFFSFFTSDAVQAFRPAPDLQFTLTRAGRGMDEIECKNQANDGLEPPVWGSVRETRQA